MDRGGVMRGKRRPRRDTDSEQGQIYQRDSEGMVFGTTSQNFPGLVLCLFPRLRVSVVGIDARDHNDL